MTALYVLKNVIIFLTNGLDMCFGCSQEPSHRVETVLLSSQSTFEKCEK